jgi:DNA mismatch endonuclease (patch repair protein)
MVDTLDPTQRSALMARVGSMHTAPELAVRRAAHAAGLRFRLHRRDLPGRPDLVFPRLRTVVFVHGCFWHRHLACSAASTPKTRVDFWEAKFEENIQRDRRAEKALRSLGWRVVTIWECEAHNKEKLARRLAEITSAS